MHPGADNIQIPSPGANSLQTTTHCPEHCCVVDELEQDEQEEPEFDEEELEEEED